MYHDALKDGAYLIVEIYAIIQTLHEDWYYRKSICGKFIFEV